MSSERDDIALKVFMLLVEAQSEGNGLIVGVASDDLADFAFNYADAFMNELSKRHTTILPLDENILGQK